MIYTIITFVIVFASILLIGVVLIQNSKGGGLSSGLQARNKFVGVKKATDTVETATWVLVSVVIVLSVVSAAFIPNDKNSKESELKDVYEESAPAAAPTNVPGEQ